MHQTWRRHINLLNALVFGVLLLIALAAWFVVPIIDRALHPHADATLRSSVAVVGSDFVAQVRVTNNGDRSLLFHQIRVTYKDETGEQRTYMRLVKPDDAPLSVDAQKTDIQTVAFAAGPGEVHDPIIRVAVVHFDGTSQVLLDSLQLMMSSSVGRPPLLPGN